MGFGFGGEDELNESSAGDRAAGEQVVLMSRLRRGPLRQNAVSPHNSGARKNPARRNKDIFDGNYMTDNKKTDVKVNRDTLGKEVKANGTDASPTLFELVADLPIGEVIEEVCGVPLLEVGQNALCTGSCPFCKHNDCCRVNVAENFFYCFSCLCGGDAVTFVATYHGIPPYAAAVKIANCFNLDANAPGTWENLPVAPKAKQVKVDPFETLSVEELQRRRTILQEFVDRGVTAMWARSSAAEYQTTVRGHKEEVLRRFRVGVMTSTLIIDLIRDKVCTAEDLRALGLINEQGRSVIAPGCFTYPLYDEQGALCGVSTRDPQKKLHGQQFKEGRLGRSPFFGMQQFVGAAPGTEVLVTEGPDDGLSVIDSGYPGIVLATWGSVKTEQIAWMAKNANKYKICTMFDNDTAGDGFRERVADALNGVVEQFVPLGGGMDPDDFVRAGGSIVELMALQRIKGVESKSVAVPEKSEQPLPDSLSYLKVLSHMPAEDKDPSDVSVARALASMSDGKIVYVKETGEWSFFDGCWEHKCTDVAFRQVVAIGDAYKQAASVAGDPEEAKDQSKIAKRLHTVRKIESVLEAASNDQRLLVSASKFDANERLLGVRNGVIDLQKMEFRPALPADYISKFCNVDYDLEADCPVFKAFLSEAFRYKAVVPEFASDEVKAEAELRVLKDSLETLDYIQWAMGQLLLWKPGRRWIAHLYGPPGSGKSTLVETLQFLLGDYATAVDPKAFAYTSKPGSGPSPDIAKLLGIRFVTVPEAGDEHTLNDELLKALSGGDTVSARFLNKNPIEFRFGGMIWFIGNTRPSSKTNGPAFFRRFRIIPMLNSRPEDEQDRNLEGQLRKEASGILNFALEGLRKFGMKEPPIPQPMRHELDVYREEMDIIGLWILENCKTGDGVECATTSLYENYAAFVRTIGSLPLGRNKFQQRMIERGYPKVRRGNIATLVGITIDAGLLHNEKH